MELIWTDIQDVIPNPLNPRKDPSSRTVEMQRILKEKGWETGITCYKKGSKYIILSGHRRWYAAHQLGENKVPVLIVERPENEAEELERLGSVQGGKVDWSSYEWAKYTHEMWCRWDKCPYQELASKMGVSTSLIASRVKVFEYYPHNEIEERMEKGIYSLSALYHLTRWLERLKANRAMLVLDYKEEMIRKTMLRKIERNQVKVVDLKNDSFIKMATDEQIKGFLTNHDKSLSVAISEVNVAEREYRHTSQSNAQIKKINKRVLSIHQMDAESNEEKQQLIQQLQKLRNEILLKEDEIKDFLQFM